MNQHNHHGHEHKHNTHSTKRAPHKDWRLWAGVVLMLIAIVAYILSLDEEIVPGEPGIEQPVPAMPAE
jgi:hypothetical protein